MEAKIEWFEKKDYIVLLKFVIKRFVEEQNNVKIRVKNISFYPDVVYHLKDLFITFECLEEDMPNEITAYYQADYENGSPLSLKCLKNEKENFVTWPIEREMFLRIKLFDQIPYVVADFDDHYSQCFSEEEFIKENKEEWKIKTWRYLIWMNSNLGYEGADAWLKENDLSEDERYKNGLIIVDSEDDLNKVSEYEDKELLKHPEWTEAQREEWSSQVHARIRFGAKFGTK